MNKRLLTGIFSIVVVFSSFALANAKTDKKEVKYAGGKFEKQTPYSLVKDNNSNANIKTALDIRSENELNTYKNNSKKNLDIVKNNYENKEIPLTVTFSKPISTEELEKLVKKYGYSNLVVVLNNGMKY